MSLKHGSLFSGIGGFDLAAQWMNWENVFHCEWNDFGRKVLEYYWPNAISYGDITQTDFTIHRGNIDILTGGFPCQPYSAAGKRKGKEDERHLWPEMLRAIQEIQPTWIVGENVSGLVNWNGGMVFDEVQADLETEGYEVLPFLLPACGVGAPHKRERVWFIAYTGLQRQTERQEQPMGIDELCTKRIITNCSNTGSESMRQEWKNSVYGLIDVANTNNERLQGSEKQRSTEESRKNWNKQPAGFFQPDWKNFPTQPPVRSGDDGLPTELDGITIPKHRNESVKAFGNAIVPQVALQIFKAISKAGSAGQKNNENGQTCSNHE